MKKQVFLLSAAILAATLVACGQSEQKAQPVTLDSTGNQTSYLMGYEMARQMQRDGITPNAEAMAQGAQDALAGADAKVSDQDSLTEVTSVMENYLAVAKDAIALQKKEANPIWQEGQAFLAENAKKDGVITTASGLQYKVITEGTGAAPGATDKVEVHYEGTLIDGTVFDSSIARGETINFGLNQVIKGWGEGLQLMKEGSKYEFYIPSELAYGGQQRSAEIVPHSTLVFQVELFKVNP